MLNPDLQFMNNFVLINLGVGRNPIHKCVIQYRFVQILMLEVFVLDEGYGYYSINYLFFVQCQFIEFLKNRLLLNCSLLTKKNDRKFQFFKKPFFSISNYAKLFLLFN